MLAGVVLRVHPSARAWHVVILRLSDSNDPCMLRKLSCDSSKLPENEINFCSRRQKSGKGRSLDLPGAMVVLRAEMATISRAGAEEIDRVEPQLNPYLRYAPGSEQI